MKPERAVEILEDLLQGIHISKNELMRRSIAYDINEIQDALGCALQVLNELGMAKNISEIPDSYEGMGPIDKDEFSYRFLHGETIPQLARRYGRTEKAIRLRLFYMGYGGDGPSLGRDKDGE